MRSALLRPASVELQGQALGQAPLGASGSTSRSHLADGESASLTAGGKSAFRVRPLKERSSVSCFGKSDNCVGIYRSRRVALTLQETPILVTPSQSLGSKDAKTHRHAIVSNRRFIAHVGLL